jgi:hypothetical protein
MIWKYHGIGNGMVAKKLIFDNIAQFFQNFLVIRPKLTHQVKDGLRSQGLAVDVLENKRVQAVQGNLQRVNKYSGYGIKCNTIP